MTESISKKPSQDFREGTSVTHWGVVKTTVVDGKISKIEPIPEDRRPSPNLKALAELPYAPSRIRYPMVRESYLKEGIASRDRRGEDKWIRVSWEEALDLIASELKRVYSEYGPSAIFGQSYGWKSPGTVNSASTLQRRLLSLSGGYVSGVNSYSTAAIGTILPYVVGTGDPQSTDWNVVLKNSERVVLWGADPIVTNDIDWSTTLHNYFPYLEKLKTSGIKTIDINPVRTETGEFLSSEWIAPKPGTDCALMLGMMYELESSGKSDKNFLKNCTSGFEVFRDYLLGKSDGIPKSPEWASEITGITADKIRLLTHELADNRTMIMMGWGIQRIQYGEQPHWMAFTLASVLGQIGLPGGGVGTNYHYSSGGCPFHVGPMIGGLAPRAEPVPPRLKPWKGSAYIPVMRFADCFLYPGKTIEHNGKRLTYPDIRMVMWTGGNPFAHQPETNRLLSAWKKPETIVVTDCFMTATARHADIVLPAQTVFEHSDICPIGTYTNDGIAANHAMIAPIGESRSDYQIYSELARRMGVEHEFTLGLDEMEWIRAIYQDAKNRGLSSGIQLPTFEEFWSKCIVFYTEDESSKKFIAFEEFRKDPAGHPLRTESGKIQIFSPRIASYGYDDCRGYPSYFEPSESLNNKKKYPLAYMSGKSAHRLHSQLDGTSHTASHNIGDREPIWIHPDNAAERGIKTGDVVLVRNDRGSALAGAFVTDKVRKDVVLLRHGGWFEPQKQEDGSTLDVHGNANSLTMDVPTSKLACGNVASSGLVEVEKFEGDLPTVTIREKTVSQPKS